MSTFFGWLKSLVPAIAVEIYHYLMHKNKRLEAKLRDKELQGKLNDSKQEEDKQRDQLTEEGDHSADSVIRSAIDRGGKL